MTPAQTTAIGVRARVTRSADSSKVCAASRCTPPSPPVAKTPIPAAAATALVRGHGGGAVRAGRRGHGEVADGELGHPVDGGEAGQLGVVEADDQLAADHADGRGDGAGVPYRLLDLAGDPQVVRPGQAVRDDGALQGDDGTAVAQGVGDLGAVADVKVGHVRLP